MVERRDLYRVLMWKPEGKSHLEDPGVDGKILLRWIFRKSDIGARTGWIWLRIGQVAGTCLPLGSIKCGEFLD